jgi:hypothetical protein
LPDFGVFIFRGRQQSKEKIQREDLCYLFLKKFSYANINEGVEKGGERGEGRGERGEGRRERGEGRGVRGDTHLLPRGSTLRTSSETKNPTVWAWYP